MSNMEIPSMVEHYDFDNDGNRLVGSDGIYVLASDYEKLEGALKELLDSTLAQMPPFEEGKVSQDAWADRRAKARNDAAFLLGSSPPSGGADGG